MRPSPRRRASCGARGASSPPTTSARTSRRRSTARSITASRYTTAMPIEPVDLLHLGHERVIAAYVVETPEGPALFDCGPATSFARLEEAVDVAEIRHLLLSHIHLDHAGAAGHLVRANPQIRVHVSDVGAPHLVEPSRLVSSARRLYGDDLDTLYGEPIPIPEENVEPIWDVAAGVKAFATPGHASHHVCYLLDDGTLLAGDAAG